MINVKLELKLSYATSEQPDPQHFGCDWHHPLGSLLQG